MAEGVVSFVVETIGNLLIEEARFLHGVSDQVEQLQLELNRMQSFLRDADERKHDEERIKECISQARDLAYEVEDLLESYAFRVANPSRNNPLKRCVCILNECYASHTIGSQILTLKSKASNLSQSFRDFGIGSMMGAESSASLIMQQYRRTYSHVVEDDFVGLQSDVEVLVHRLIEENHMVVSIYGMGGSGKSTLARKVYNHPKVKRHFDGFCWMCISQRWQMRDILQGILVGLTREDRKEIEKWRDEELVKEISQVQQNRRCLVVLDDIWSTDAWECIKQAFQIRKNGSKILLTTRNREVAMQIGPSGFHHPIRLLNDDESWKLLLTKALKERPHQDHEEIHKMKELGKKMVESCGGLPLAVVILGGILVMKKGLQEWETVYSNINVYLGMGNSVVDQEGKLHNILASSYDDLPHKLKPCFLYLSRFEEDSDIYMETLYQLWIAEGMISMKDRIGNQESMMDVAERYFTELVERCMVQVETSSDDENMPIGRITRFASCRLHDLMRELSLSKTEEENFCSFYRSRDGSEQDEMLKFNSSSVSSTRKVHRLVITLSEPFEKLPLEKRTTRHLRSLVLSFSHVSTGFSQRAVNAPFNMFSMLRVLVIEGPEPLDIRDFFQENNFCLAVDRFKLLRAIGGLIHLRYLRLEWLHFCWISSSIGNLLHLQTLDFRTCRVDRLPNVLWKMKWLTHLYLPEIINKKRSRNFKLRVDKLSHLQVLVNFRGDYCCAEDLYKLTNLRELSASVDIGPSAGESGTEIVDYILKSKTLRRTSLTLELLDGYSSVHQEKFTSLFGQCLSSCKIHELSLVGAISNLPKFSEANLVDSVLVDVHLSGIEMEEDPMVTLERLPNLQSLLIIGHVLKEMHCHPSGFPQLRHLYLSVYSLEEWTIDEGAMPKLSNLSIVGCKNLEMIPDGLKFVKTLQELKVRDMPKELRDRIQEEGADFHKIRHIPSVIFSYWIS